MKFNELIAKIKDKLPRKKSDGEDDFDEGTEVTDTEVTDTEVTGDHSETDATEQFDQKGNEYTEVTSRFSQTKIKNFVSKNPRRMAIYVVVGLGVLYLLGGLFTGEEEAVVKDSTQQERSKKRSARKKRRAAAKKRRAAEKKKIVMQGEVEKAKKEGEKGSKIKSAVVVKPPVKTKTEDSAKKTVDKSKEFLPKNNEKVVEKSNLDIPPEVPTEVLKPKEQAVVEKAKSKVGEGKTTDAALKEQSGEGLEDIKNSRERKLSYVEPPTYLRAGRGLVYNCKGRHWACVDKYSYFTCQDNYKWSKQNENRPECTTRNVYATARDCKIVQIHYVNTGEKIDSCNHKQ